MSIGVPRIGLSALVVDVQPARNGRTSRAINPACKPMEIVCVQPKFSSFDQISFTLIGVIPGGSAAGLLGEKNSFKRSVKLPKLPPQSTSNFLLIGALRTFGACRKKFRFSRSPAPNDLRANGPSVCSPILTGRSNRNCFKLDQMLSGIRCSGVVNSGRAEVGIGTTSSGPLRLGLLNSSGRRLIGSA